MEVIHGLGERPPVDPERGSVVTIGFFDGVHRGHRAVFERTVAVAKERGLAIRRRHLRPAPARDPDAGERAEAPHDARAQGHADRGARDRPCSWCSRSREEFSRRPGRVVRPADPGRRPQRPARGRRRELHVRPPGRWGPSHAPGRRSATTPASRCEGVGAPADRGARRVVVLDPRGPRARRPRRGPPRRSAAGTSSTARSSRAARAGGPGSAIPTANLEVPGRMLLPGEGVYAGRATAPAGTVPRRDQRRHEPHVRRRAAARRRRSCWTSTATFAASRSRSSSGSGSATRSGSSHPAPVAAQIARDVERTRSDRRGGRSVPTVNRPARPAESRRSFIDRVRRRRRAQGSRASRGRLAESAHPPRLPPRRRWPRSRAATVPTSTPTPSPPGRPWSSTARATRTSTRLIPPSTLRVRATRGRGCTACSSATTSRS